MTSPLINRHDLEKKLGIGCDRRCTYHPDNIGWDAADKLLAARAKGMGPAAFQRLASELLGREASLSSVVRHLKHYVEAAETPTPGDLLHDKPSDVEILDSIIVAGYRNSRSWKPTIKDTIEAMKLKTAMTGNSAFGDLIALFDAEEGDDGEIPPPETVEAALSAEELPNDDSEDLGEPIPGLE